VTKYGNSEVESVHTVEVCRVHRCSAPFVLSLDSRWPLCCWGNKKETPTRCL